MLQFGPGGAESIGFRGGSHGPFDGTGDIMDEMIMIAEADIAGEEVERKLGGLVCGGNHAKQASDGAFADAFVAGAEQIFAEEPGVVFSGDGPAEF